MPYNQSSPVHSLTPLQKVFMKIVDAFGKGCCGKNRRLTPHSGIDKVTRCSVRPENQFSFTRAALNTDGRAKINFLSV
jgi:hypothetical protein